MDTNKVVVVVTGFGPFRQYLENPSWHAAQSLKAVGLGGGVQVHIKELPVSYSRAQQIIVDVWKTLKPNFAIHLGIAPCARAIFLEQTGKNHGYVDRDVCGSCPVNHCCIDGGPDKLDSMIDMRSLSKQLKRAGKDVVFSRDAGRYLCDFVYYCSLYHGQGRAAFIHVPASGSLASSDELVPLLETIILTLLQQLDTLTSSSSNSSSSSCSFSSSQISGDTGTAASGIPLTEGPAACDRLKP